MAVSVFDLFKIGIGPSSPHTVGPMRAAKLFLEKLANEGQLAGSSRIHVQLYGSLALTGKGHGTDKAVLLGLLGDDPDTCDVDTVEQRLEQVRSSGKMLLLGQHEVAFKEKTDLQFARRETLPYHSNGMRVSAYDEQGSLLEQRTYYSVGGGFVISDEALAQQQAEHNVVPVVDELPYPFSSGKQLLDLCIEHKMSIAQLMWHNEQH